MSVFRPKVLVVDDDPAMLRLLAHWLEHAGYPVTTASDGQQAMLAIDAECPQILVTDWEMPYCDGIDLCKWVRSRKTPHYVYTIFVTIRTALTDMVKGLEAGADDFIKKPLDRDELLARMRAAVRVLELEQRLSLLAKCDPLTGLPSKRTLNEFLQREWARAARHHFPLSCVMLDIDYFKRVNDTYGHPAGDEVIRQVADVLQQHCRSSDIVCRYGGEEFCVLMPETDEGGAAIWADRIRERIGKLKIALGETQLSVAVSCGVAQRAADTRGPDSLIDMADQALLVAKRSGRDRVITWRSLAGEHPIQNTGTDPATLLNNVAARHVMTAVVAGLNQDDTIGSASRYFLRFRINSAPVVDQKGQLVGVISDKEIMAVMLWPQWWATKIRDVMKTNVVSYDEQTPALAIYEFLCRVTVRSAVVVSRGRPIGIISRGSLLRYFSNVIAVSNQANLIPETERPTSPVNLLDLSGLRPKQRIMQTIRAVQDEASDLQQRVEDADADLIPCVVGGASRIQELVSDLLACSQYLGEAHDHDEFADAYHGGQVQGLNAFLAAAGCAEDEAGVAG